ncbi:MAG TPA: hypothetical protein VKC56_07120 [Gallionellaceae bacterium]|nr:hypothetical protein [Gallionellaceae bacterium]
MGFFDLRKELPGLMPHAVQWAEATAEYAAMSGRPLEAAEQALARRVGVVQPDKIRLLVVDQMPYPEHPLLQVAAMATDFLGPQSLGLTLGHTVVVRRGHESARLYSHEFRHVHQYEQAGSIAAFLPVYLEQLVEDGYADAPLEQDARAHEIAD